MPRRTAWRSKHDEPSRSGGRPRSAIVQQQADPHRGGQRVERRSRRPGPHRHLHDVSRHAPCGQPFDSRAAEHRIDRRIATHTRPAPLHVAQQAHVQDDRNHGPGPRAHHGKVEGHRQGSKARSFARSPQGRRTSTTGRRAISPRSSTSTTSASRSASPTTRKTTWSRSFERSDYSGTRTPTVMP